MGQENNQVKEKLLKRKKILVVDYAVAVYDDIRFCYEKGFGEEYEFLLAEDLEECLAKIKNQTPDLIISEICLFSTKHRSEKEKQESRVYWIFPLTQSKKINKGLVYSRVTLANKFLSLAVYLQKWDAPKC